MLAISALIIGHYYQTVLCAGTARVAASPGFTCEGLFPNVIFILKSVGYSLILLINLVEYLLKTFLYLFSYDSLRIIESLEEEHHEFSTITEQTPTHRLQSTLDKLIGLTMAFNGSIQDSLSKSNGAFMIEIGRRLERSKQLVSMVQNLLQFPLLRSPVALLCIICN